MLSGEYSSPTKSNKHFFQSQLNRAAVSQWCGRRTQSDIDSFCVRFRLFSAFPLDIFKFHVTSILFWTILTAKERKLTVIIQLTNWFTDSKGVDFLSYERGFPHFGRSHKYNCSVDKISSPVLSWSIWNQSVLISYSSTLTLSHIYPHVSQAFSLRSTHHNSVCIPIPCMVLTPPITSFFIQSIYWYILLPFLQH